MRTRSLLVFVLLLLSLLFAQSSASQVRKINGDDQIDAVLGLVKRLLPRQASWFEFHLESAENGTEYFHLETVGNHLQINGTSGVALASGLNYWLKNYCHSQVAWNQTALSIPAVPPRVPPTLVTSPYKFRYYYNVCTYGYSTVWWTWERWQFEIDWMALNGINLPLAFLGQEYVWQQLFTQMGLNESSVADFFTGPAFLPWQRMGNVYEWAGPLPQSWIARQRDLQLQVLARMRSFGMSPVLPGFAGHVPAGLKDMHPTASITQLARWANFTGTWYLAPTDPLFAEIGTAFVKLQTALYGTDHFYNADPFNELLPPSNDTTFLAASARAVYTAMTAADPQAVWVLQAWFLVHTASFWQPPQAQAFLTAVPLEHLLVLDLWSENSPAWQQTQSYYGRHWIWNMLHNFGGRSGIYGTLPNVTNGPPVALQSSPYLQGLGMTPEGIDTNYITYDLLTDMMWRTTPVNLSEWVSDFTVRRYNAYEPAAIAAYEYLRTSVYSCNPSWPKTGGCSGTPRSLVAMRPSLTLATTLYYDTAAVVSAWKSLISAQSTLSHSDLYRYDLVEVTRQVMTNLMIPLYNELKAAFTAGNVSAIQQIESQMRELIADMDTLVGTRAEFLLGRWIADAQAWATSPPERRLYEFNARIQLTTWGPITSQIIDYAYKLWSGLVGDYYRERWTLFTQYLANCLVTKQPYSAAQVLLLMNNYAQRWNSMDGYYPPTPSGDSIAVANAMYEKYLPWTTRASVPASGEEDIESFVMM